MVFSDGYGQQQIGDNKKCRRIAGDFDCHTNAAVRRYNVGRIAQYNTSKASLGATGCRHRASACAVLPRRPSWSTNSLKQH